MSFKIVKAAALAICSTLMFSGSSAFAQEAQSLDQLLDFVKKGQVAESKENRAREATFTKDKANQAAAVKKAEAERTRQEQISAQLEKTFEDNDLLIADKQKQLKERLGTLTELFGHLTSASGDLASTVEVSLASAQYPGREVFLQEFIAKMTNSDSLPSIEEIERVWFELLRETRETGVVTRFLTEVASPAGERAEREVIRIGAFNIVDTDGNPMTPKPDKSKFTPGAMHIHDLNATILHLLGIDHRKLTFRYQGRDFRLTDVHGHVIHDIVA